MIAVVVALPLLAVFVGLGLGLLARRFKRYDAMLTREWSNAVGDALRQLPGFEDATNGVTDEPIPVFVWRGVTVVAERDIEADFYGPTRFGLTVSGIPLISHPRAGLRLRVTETARPSTGPAAIARLGALPVTRATALVLAELLQAEERACRAGAAARTSAGARLGLVR